MQGYFEQLMGESFFVPGNFSYPLWVMMRAGNEKTGSTSGGQTPRLGGCPS
jgi:hypothetical protein